MRYNDNMQDGYEITEQDIEGIVHVLEVFDPEHANEDTARKFLNHLKFTTRESISSFDADQLANLYQQMTFED